jgi:hypothetical protein
MILSIAEPWLSASITAPAAWAAFTAVQRLPWSLRIATWSPLRFDVAHGYDFQACLDDAGSFAFEKRARGEIALRILAVAGDFDERQLRVRHLCPDALHASPAAEQRALEDLKGAIISRVRHELEYLFDHRPQSWADRVKHAINQLPVNEKAQASRYLGIDQELTGKQCVAGLNYVFSTLEPLLVRNRSGIALAGHPRKLGEARAARHDLDPKARARNLAVRAVDSRLFLLSADNEFDEILLDLAVDGLLPMLKEDLLELVRSHGCWGLIDAAIRRDRVTEAYSLPEVLPANIWDLVRQQEERIDQIDERLKS